MSDSGDGEDLPPLPEKIACPECGHYCEGEEVREAKMKENLSNNGYLHRDVWFTCPECGYGDEEDERWVHGIPVRNYDGGEDLWCDACETWYMVHRVGVEGMKLVDGEGMIRVPEEGIVLHVKCPVCFDFKRVKRVAGNSGIALVGFPPITGEINRDTAPFGYDQNPP